MPVLKKVLLSRDLRKPAKIPNPQAVDLHYSANFAAPFCDHGSVDALDLAISFHLSSRRVRRWVLRHVTAHHIPALVGVPGVIDHTIIRPPGAQAALLDGVGEGYSSSSI